MSYFADFRFSKSSSECNFQDSDFLQISNLCISKAPVPCEIDVKTAQQSASLIVINLPADLSHGLFRPSTSNPLFSKDTC